MADKTEYKKYDSNALFIMQNARLAKDPQIIEGGDKPMVKLTVVLTSRSDRHADTWVEITVNDRQADLASYFEKGDKLGFHGFPATRTWGDNNEKTSFEVVRAELAIPPDLIAECKERGWSSGGEVKGAGKGKKNAKGGKTPPKGKKQREVQEVDDEDLDADGDE